MKKILVLLMAFVFFVAACNNNKNGKNPNLNNRGKDDYGKNNNQNNDDENTGTSGWSEKDRNSTLKECIASFDEDQAALANRICSCVLKKMEKEYASYNEADTKGGEAAVERIALQCKEEIAGNNLNTGNSWSKSDENQWMNACATPLIESLGEENANNYCSCVMDKLKEMYSSFNDANTKGTQEMGIELGKKCLKQLGIGQ